MSEITDRLLAPLIRRVDMMIARGVLLGTDDARGIQRMQVSLLDGEVADDVERFQTYGISTVPPNGGDVLTVFVSGNRDHGIILACNDRGSRPRDLKAGEVRIYNDRDVSIALTADGDLKITTEKEITLETTEKIIIKAPEIEIEGDVKITGNLEVSGRIDADTIFAPNGSVG